MTWNRGCHAALVAVTAAVALMTIPSTAFARTGATAAASGGGRLCVVRTSPARFVEQGEGATAGSVADIVEVACNPEVYGAGQTVKLSSPQLFSRCGGHMEWSEPSPLHLVPGADLDVTLDPDGNARAVLLAGPGCQAGESLVSAHLDEAPYETFTTTFSVLPPERTVPGVFALPAREVEDDVHSAVATIVEVEFPPKYAEKLVHISAEELFAACQAAPHLVWLGPEGKILNPEPELEEGIEAAPLGLVPAAESVSKVRLDNEGNAFVVLVGDSSCASTRTLIEADLESTPYTTYTTSFTVEPPQPTYEEGSFAIEKLQQIEGSRAPFTTQPLSAAVGQRVAYEIVVTNTGGVPETLSGLTDGRCEAGTLHGGPGESALAAGASTTYTCSRLLPAVGSYTNEALITGTSPAGSPVTHTSNEVVTTVPPEPRFTVEKLQRVAGSETAFTKSQLSATLGETIEYAIVVTNTGNVPLLFSSFTDPHCDGSTIAGGPGEAAVAPGSSTTFTCSHMLTAVGTYINEAAVSGSPQGEETPTVGRSQPVEAIVTANAAFSIEKLQRIGGAGAGFTTAPLTGASGQSVEYEIVVRNTGGVALALSGLSDEHCDHGTLAGGPGAAPLAPGGEATYTCTRLLGGPGAYDNEASVTATAPGESPFSLRSNDVQATVPPGSGGVLSETKCTPPAGLRGVAGPMTGPFSVSLPARGIASASFSLDGHRLLTLRAKQARHGRFSVRIDPRRLSFGVHRLTVAIALTTSGCPNVSRSAVFVHPRSQIRAVHFTG